MENFSKIFNIAQGDVISFTGGGGKTSLIFSLAEELSKKGRVLITTTTKMYIPEEESYDSLILQNSLAENLEKKCEETLKKTENSQKRNIDFLADSLDLENGKILGVDDGVLEKYIGEYDYILIEADGSAGKALKHWNGTDPVISKYSNKIIGITNLEALGKTVEEGVHRYESFCENYGVEKEKKIDCELMIKYISSAEFFNEKEIQKYIFINGVESLESFNSALEISRELDFENIVLGSIKIGEIYPYRRIVSVALLSGLSTRMGEDKLFLDFINKPLVSYLMENLFKINFHQKIRIVRDIKSDKIRAIENPLIEKEKFEKGDFNYARHINMINKKPQEGQSYSISMGVRYIRREENKEFKKRSAFMFFMGDQPLLKFETILKLMKEFMKSGEITLPVVEGVEYSPVIFPNEYGDKLCKIKGDRGGKSIIQPEDILNRVTFQDKTEFMDVDTREELRELERIAMK